MPSVEPGTFQATITGTIAVLLAAACWALSGIFVKLIMVDDQVSSLTLAFWRDTAAFVVFVFTFALGRLPAGIASIRVMSEIAFAVFYARLFLGETLAPIEITGALVVVAGVIFWLAPSAATQAIRPSPRR